MAAIRRLLSCNNLRNFRKTFYSTGNFVRVSVTPEKGLVDDDLSVRVQGLKPYQRVTLFCHLQEQGWKFGSKAQYVADNNGELDTTFQESVGGSYKGCEPEGLLWAMEPLPYQKNAIRRLLKKDIAEPFDVKLKVIDGHTGWDAVKAEPLSEVSFERWYLAPNVTRTEIRHGSVRGTLFVPDGPGPYPAVIDLFGAAGRIIDHRAALLASKGFATLALPYFGYEDLQKTLKCVDLEYFEEAINFMLGQNVVDSNVGVGVIGVSKGAEIAMSMAELFPEVTAVIAINGLSFVSDCPTIYKPRAFRRNPPEYDLSRVKWIQPHGLANCTNLFEESWVNDERYSIKIDKSNAQFLFIGSELDDCVHPKYAQLNADKLKNAGKDNYEVVIYPGAGHLLEPPHAPLGTEAYNRAAKCMMSYGGEPKMHARAQEKSWELIQNFFRAHLCKIVLESPKREELTLVKSML